MHIMNAYVSCLRRTVASHSASDVKNLITWSDSAKKINAALSAQTNITLKDAWCLWIKNIVLTAMKIMNSEDASVSNDDSKWNKHLKSIKTDRSNMLQMYQDWIKLVNVFNSDLTQIWLSFYFLFSTSLCSTSSFFLHHILLMS